MSICIKWNIGTVIFLFLISLSQPLFALSTFQSAFEGIYSGSETSKTADCQTCHANNTFQLNSYGKALCDQLSDEKNSSERLLSFSNRAAVVEALDSDGDSFSNIEEINNSTQPGWTLGNLNPTFQKLFNRNECVATGLFEEAPAWVKSGGLDPVPAENLAPVAINDTSSTSPDTPVTINVLANDFDANGDTIEVYSINTGASAHGLADNNTTDITYTPEANFCGTAILQYQITDNITPSNMATITISVGDNVAPIVTAPSSNLLISIPAGSSQLPANDIEIVNWLSTASAIDANDGELLVTVNAPDNFEAGTTTVIFSAIDSCGNTNTATANVIITVESNNTPVVTVPSPDPLILSAGLCATSIPSADPGISNWLQQATAFDLEDGSVTVSNDAPANFVIGNKNVVFSATDSLGAIGSATATISVNETPNTTPVLTSPSAITILVSASTTSVPITNNDIQNFLSLASATDDEDGTLIVSHDAPAEFNLGTTTVTFQATDNCGLTSTSQSTVTVVANLINNPPSIVAPSPIDVETALCLNSLPITDPLIAKFLSGTSLCENCGSFLALTIS